MRVACQCDDAIVHQHRFISGMEVSIVPFVNFNVEIFMILCKLLLNHWNHINIWQVSPRLSCSNACQILAPQIARFMGLHGAHLGTTGPRWAPCWPHEPYYQGRYLMVHNILVVMINKILKNGIQEFGLVIPPFPATRHCLDKSRWITRFMTQNYDIQGVNHAVNYMNTRQLRSLQNVAHARQLKLVATCGFFY